MNASGMVVADDLPIGRDTTGRRLCHRWFIGREPQNSSYYQCVQDHFEAFEQVYEERFERQYGFFRPHISHVIYLYLDCGDLPNGFARVRASAQTCLRHKEVATT